MNRSRFRRSLRRMQKYSRKRLAKHFPAGSSFRHDGAGREPSEFMVLATYSEALAANAENLEQIKGRQDVSAVEGFVNCAAIVSAILKTSWRDEASALDLAARAVLLSRSFLHEFLEASGGALDPNEHFRLARSMQVMGQF